MQALFQSTLFETQTPALPGLTYVRDVLSVGDERKLANYIAGLELTPFAYRGFTGKRRTASFGWRYDFNGGGFERARPLPSALQDVREKVALSLALAPEAFEQCTLIEYAPGAGIGWHKDRPHFAKVAGLSLLSPCRFRFRRGIEKRRWERKALLLEPRSVYLLEGEARNVWQHSIPTLDDLRYAITFRTLAR